MQMQKTADSGLFPSLKKIPQSQLSPIVNAIEKAVSEYDFESKKFFDNNFKSVLSALLDDKLYTNSLDGLDKLETPSDKLKQSLEKINPEYRKLVAIYAYGLSFRRRYKFSGDSLRYDVSANLQLTDPEKNLPNILQRRLSERKN